MAGGVVDVSSTTPTGEYNSRPSTRLGFVVSPISLGCPTALEGEQLRVTPMHCPKAAEPPNKRRQTAEIWSFIWIPGGRDAESAPIEDIKKTGHHYQVYVSCSSTIQPCG